MNQDFKAIFIGTAPLSADILSQLLATGFIFDTIVTQPDRPAGRKQQLQPSPVKQIALDNNIPVLQPEKIQDITNELQALKPDVMLLIAYGQIIPQNIIDIAPHGIINVHPSLLPKYRGPSPIQAALLHNDTKTGVSIMQLDKKMDHGPILSQQEIEIDSNDNDQTLTSKVIDLSVKMLTTTLPDFVHAKITPQPQDHNLATFCKLIKKQDGHINWDQPATKINGQIKAYYSWPKTFNYIATSKGRKQLVFRQAQVTEHNSNNPPGTILSNNNTLYITSADKLLEITEIQPQDKKSMSGADFLRGYGHLVGKRLE